MGLRCCCRGRGAGRLQRGHRADAAREAGRPAGAGAVPRFHIGESQLPWSNEVFRALGAEEAIATAGFVTKWGASFRRPDGGAERYADFQVAVETPTPQTFQVLRERFDEILRCIERAALLAISGAHQSFEGFAEDLGINRCLGPIDAVLSTAETIV